MKAFRYERARTLEAAVRALSEGGALLKANGIDVLDRMKDRVDEPPRVVTIVDVPGLDRIEATPEGGLRIGAMATLAAVAASPEVAKACPALAEAAEGAASPQLRNRATVGGNLAQHTRCGYYRIKTFPCFKRDGAPCPVLAPGAVQETAGIFQNDRCACAHPSSLAPVLGAADARIVILGKKGERTIPFADLWHPPQQGVAADVTLEAGDVIRSVEIPADSAKGRIAYLEVRHRASFDWALASCAAWLLPGPTGVERARIWLGAVAPTPWRAAAAEKAVEGKAFSEDVARKAGEAALAGATPLPGTAYKSDLVRVVVRRALVAAHGR